MSERQEATNHVLADEDLDRLESLLDDSELPEAMRLDEVQGYLCAVLSGPQPLPEDVWLADVLGNEEALASAPGREAAELLRAFARELEAGLAAGEPPVLYLYGRDDDENGMAANLFDGVIIALIFISTVQVVLDTFTLPPAAVRISRWVEVVLVVVFTAEYALRLWTAPLADPARTPLRARLRYLVRPMAVIDLLAILPFYLPFVFPIDLRVLRALH